MRFWWVFILFAACDYAPAEDVRELSREVQDVRGTQRMVETRIEATEREQATLRVGFSAMGSGFNVLSESVVDHGGRVNVLEEQGGQIAREIGALRKETAARPQRSAAAPKQGRFTGVRTDTLTLAQDPIHMRWCEAGEGVEGYLLPQVEEPDRYNLRCWRFGDVALFRQGQGEELTLTCLRSITVESDGTVQALDCDRSNLLYRFSPR